MSLESDAATRLQFLSRIVQKECKHLLVTDTRLFEQPFDIARVHEMDRNDDLAERVDAFVGRFGRLQDTLGDKLLPQLLMALGERPGAAIDNLDRAERLELIDSTEEWMKMRTLRNQMIHEYIEDPAILANALQTGHQFVPKLTNAAKKMSDEVKRRTANAVVDE